MILGLGPKLLEMRHEILEQDRYELVRARLVGDEHLQDREDVRVGKRLLDEEVEVGQPDFGEDVGLKEQEDLRQQLDSFLCLSWIPIALKDGEAAQAVLEELAKYLAVGWW